jgi:outer membrane protein assembly factor BamB
MRKLGIFALLLIAVLGACSKKDPVLPGQRVAIFPGPALAVLNQDIPNLPDSAPARAVADCPYTQDSTNIVWLGSKKIFSGYPISNSVKSDRKPTCGGGFVYAGLTTGELVKINATNRNIEWIADIYRKSNMTGGSAVLDILAPIVIDGNYVYVGGLGDAFCKLRAASGAKAWCLDIGVSTPFIIVGRAAFVVSTDGNLYAIDTNGGDIYWAARVKSQTAPSYADKVITVGNQKFNAVNGQLVE